MHNNVCFCQVKYIQKIATNAVSNIDFFFLQILKAKCTTGS